MGQKSGLTIKEMNKLTIGMIFDLLLAKSKPVETDKKSVKKYRKATEKDIARMFGI